MSGTDDIVLRVAVPQDEAGILAVEREAFGEEEEAALVADLTAGEAFDPELSLVAEKDERIIGHVLFTRARAGSVDAALLAPLAVAPEWQGRGVGSALAREGLKRAATLGYGIALVLGHPTYYPRFGFEPAEARGVVPPYPVHPSEAWMLVELAPGALARARGVVEVAPELMHEEMWRE